MTEDEEDWQRLWRQTELDQSGMKQVNGYLNAQGKSVDVPEIVLAHLDSSALHAGLPDGRRGLGTLEVFMRHCEAWRLHARGEA